MVPERPFRNHFSMSSSTDPKPVVTGYPYPAPPPPPPPSYYYSSGAPPQTHYYPPPYAPAPPPRYNTTFLRRLLSILVAIFVILGLVILIIWLVLRPHLPEFTVSSASVSSFNLSASQQQLSADFDINLTVHNPNGKLGIYCDRVAAAVLYESDTLSETSLAPFYLEKGETTPLRARLVAAAVYVDPDAVRGITDRSRVDGIMGFHVRVLAWVRFRTGAWRTRWHSLRVYCDDLPVGFRNGTTAVATGYLVGPAPKKCVANI